MTNFKHLKINFSEFFAKILLQIIFNTLRYFKLIKNICFNSLSKIIKHTHIIKTIYNKKPKLNTSQINIRLF